MVDEDEMLKVNERKLHCLHPAFGCKDYQNGHRMEIMESRFTAGSSKMKIDDSMPTA